MATQIKDNPRPLPNDTDDYVRQNILANVFLSGLCKIKAEIVETSNNLRIYKGSVFDVNGRLVVVTDNEDLDNDAETFITFNLETKGFGHHPLTEAVVYDPIKAGYYIGEERVIGTYVWFTPNSDIGGDSDQRYFVEARMPNVGDVYYQLPYLPSPTEGGFMGRWVNRSGRTPGYFFRTEGGGAGQFTRKQGESFRSHFHVIPSHRHRISTYARLRTSWYASDHSSVGGAVDPPRTVSHYVVHRYFYTESSSSGNTHYSGGGETRPKNYAMRIWQCVDAYRNKA